MKVSLNRAHAIRDYWSLSASGTFNEGVHLVSGDVGSGKSTLALMIAGLFPLSGGEIDRNEIKSTMLSPQYPELLITGITIAEECLSWEIVPEEILRDIGLIKRKTESPHSLSRGELKRLHLACVLARNYDLLMFDEPFSSLDCTEKAALCTRIGKKTQGVTIVFTHEQNILPRVDRIWEIVDGILVDCGRPPDAFLAWHHIPPQIKRLIDLGSWPDNISLDDLREAVCRIRE